MRLCRRLCADPLDHGPCRERCNKPSLVVSNDFNQVDTRVKRDVLLGQNMPEARTFVRVGIGDPSRNAVDAPLNLADASSCIVDLGRDGDQVAWRWLLWLV